MSPGAVPGRFPAVFRWPRGVTPALLLAAFTLSSTAVTHDLFARYVQHRVAVVMNARHVDVTVRLTFFEDSSEHERSHMDANHDGRISPREIETYLAGLEPELNGAVTLRLSGRRLPLTPLRQPEVDLLGNDRVGRAHHQLTLFFFSPTPTNLAAGDELVVENRLWPRARALGTLQAEGADGCQLEVIPRSDPVFPSAREGEAREFKARVLKPSVKKSPSAASASTTPQP